MSNSLYAANLEQLDHQLDTIQQYAAEDPARLQEMLPGICKDIRASFMTLQMKNEHYRRLFDATPYGYLVTDKSGLIQDANQAAISLLTIDEGQLIGKSLLQYIAEEDRAGIQNLIDQLSVPGHVQRREIWLQPTQGTAFQATVTAIPLSSVPEASTGLHWSIRDITRHKALEEIWRQYEFIANTSKEFMTLINADYSYEAVNDAYCEAHHKVRAEIIDKQVSDVWGEDIFRTVLKQHLDQCFAGKEVHYRCWLEFVTLGSRYFDVAYYPYYNDENKVTHTVVISRDITDRKLAEDALQHTHEALETRVEARTAELSNANAKLKRQISKRQQIEKELRASEERYKQLLEAVTDYIYSVKIEQNQSMTMFHSPASVAVTGYTPEEYQAEPLLWHRMIHEDDQPFVTKQIESLLVGNGASSIEHRIRHKDGSLCWVKNTPVPRYNEQGQLVAYDGLLSDITERKKAEAEREALLVAERSQRLLAETLGEVFLALTAQLSHETVLDEILQQTQRIVSYSAAHIVLLEDEVLHVARWQGYDTFGSGRLPHSIQMLADLPLDSEVVRSREPLVVSDTRLDARWVTHPELSWINSFVAVPICLHERVLGLFRLDSDTAGKFSQKDIQYLQPLVNAAAIALKNAYLHDQARQEIKERIEAQEEAYNLNRKFLSLQYAGAMIASSLDLQVILNRFSREIVNLLAIEGCVIFEWDKVADQIRVIAKQGSNNWRPDTLLNSRYSLDAYPLIKWVLEKRQAQHLTVSQTDIDPTDLAYMQTNQIKTLLILPMEFQNRVVGLVEVIDHYTERMFTTDEVNFAQLLANQAASAIENAHLYDRAQQEIAERKRIEKNLRQSEAKNRALLEAIPDFMFHLTHDGILLDDQSGSDPKLYTVPEAFLNRSIRDVMPPEVVEPTQNHIDKLLDTGLMQIFEYQLQGPDDVLSYETRLVPCGDNEILAIVRNVTERKRAEEALKRSEANLKAIFDNSMQAFVLIDKDYKIRAFNRTVGELSQMIWGKLLREGESIRNLIAKDSSEHLLDSFEQALQGESVVTEQNINLGQTDNWFEFYFAPVIAEDGQITGVCFSTVNIDERKKMADALAESEARLLAEMQSVLVIARALVSEIDINKLLEFIMSQAEHLTNAEGAAVLLLSEDGQWLEVATPGEAWAQMKAGLRLLTQGSLAELAIASQRVQVSNQVREDQRVASIQALLESVELHSLLCAPLIAQGENLGVLLVWNKRKQIFTEHDNRIMALFADQAALAWHNARLHTQNRELAIEQERQRLARELHDSVTQSLYSIGLAAQASLRLLGKDSNGAQEPIIHIQQLSQTALTEMREQLYNLRPTALADKGLIEVLTGYCDRLNEQYGLTVDFAADFKPKLSMYQKESLYYIAREALWNVVKHSESNEVKLSLMREQDEIVLSILDQGAGFDAIALDQAETMGLRNMKERAKLLGGSFELQSRSERGTWIFVRIPFEPQGVNGI